MWLYQKTLIYPVNITCPDPMMAKALLAQYGGPDSELGAAMRYLTQRYTMPCEVTRATVSDIGSEELSHWEMLGTMIMQCLRNANMADIEAAGMMGYYTMHNHAVYPSDPNGVPFTASYIQSTGDPVTDLVEDLAAEQKARTTYEHLMTLTNNPEVLNPLRFLREREIVHYQRFGECLSIVQKILPNNNSRYVEGYSVAETSCNCNNSN